MVNVSIFLLFCIFGAAFAGRSFWRGRSLDDFHGDNLYLKAGNTLPSEEWFEQQTDPYDPSDNRTFNQRYYSNNEFFKTKDGPVFLLIGGAGAASPRWMIEGAWLKYAKEFGALCIHIEQRFYGKSHPTPTTATRQLPIFSSEIALTDLGLFIAAMQKKYNLTEKNRWIVFGGGYAGALAAWMRVKFSHLVHGAVSSSSPILSKMDFREYYAVVADSILDCRVSVQEAFSEFERQLQTSSGRLSLMEQFQLCDPLEESNKMDTSNLFEILASIFASVVQYNRTPYAKHSVKEICGIMTNEENGSPLDRLARLNRIFLEEAEDNCLDYKYDKMTLYLQGETWDSPALQDGNRQWFFQLCREFGFFQTSTNASHIFGNHFDVDYFLKQCTDVFGEKLSRVNLEKNVYNDYVIYGGPNIKASNTIYVYGSSDPWHPLGLTETNFAGAQTIFIPGTGHCADMYDPRDDDLPELKTARSQIREFIAELLNQN